MASRPWQVAGWIVTKILYSVWVALMIATPLFGFWLASSLAAYQNATQWLSLVIGLLLFPLLPVGWDLFFIWRRNRKGDTRKPILTRLDRLVLRTLIVNGVFLGIMMWRAPHTAFRALAVRGDWILDGHDGPIASRVRGVMLGFADHFEKRWHSNDTTYGTSDKPPEPTTVDDTPPQTIADAAKPIQPKDPNGWPLPAEVDPIVRDMPAEVQTSTRAVGEYLRDHFTDPHQLAKAVHDYVVLRLTYDVPTSKLSDAEAMTKRPSQEPDAVFLAKTAVCEGYARLFDSIGKNAGLETAYITGYIRDRERRVDDAGSDEAITKALEGYLHAWNAVKIDGKWLLVDTTWDDPVNGKSDEVGTTYLFTPPRAFIYDHLPEEKDWQLVAKPMSAGDFARQPLLTPEVARLGIVLEQPTRSQITSDGDVEIEIANPFGASIDAAVEGTSDPCTTKQLDGMKLAISCHVPPGQHAIRMFGSPEKVHAPNERWSETYFGSILVNSR